MAEMELPPISLKYSPTSGEDQRIAFCELPSWPVFLNHSTASIAKRGHSTFWLIWSLRKSPKSVLPPFGTDESRGKLAVGSRRYNALREILADQREKASSAEACRRLSQMLTLSGR
jgi:hypothetical protein